MLSSSCSHAPADLGNGGGAEGTVGFSQRRMTVGSLPEPKSPGFRREPRVLGPSVLEQLLALRDGLGNDDRHDEHNDGNRLQVAEVELGEQDVG
jgi:hypothetical protein